MAPRLSVVIPTYNEVANIAILVGELKEHLAGVDHEIIVVDDDSKDGTAAAAESAGARAIVRTEERGLATAVVAGIRAAEGEYVLVMDADLQHPSEVAPRMLARAIEDDAHVVVGTRYRDGGSAGTFGPIRRLISWGASTAGRIALPPIRQHGLSDPMSGLFLVKKDAVDLDELRPTGYKILLEILGRCPVERVSEVGYTFGERGGGESKLGAAVIFQYLAHLAALAWDHPDNRRIAKFAAVGGSGIVVNLSILFALTELVGWHYALSAAVAIEASIVTNFLLNDRFTFHDRRRGHRLLRLARFNAISFLAMGVNLAVLALLVEVLHVHYLAAEFVAILAAFAANFQGNDKWTYGGVDRFSLTAAVKEIAAKAAWWLPPVVLAIFAIGIIAPGADDPDTFIFDETYYVSVGRQIDNGIWHDPCWETDSLSPRPLNYEHPPLAKLIIAWSIDHFDTGHEVFEGCRDPSSDEHAQYMVAIEENGNPWAWRAPSIAMGVLAVVGITVAATRIFWNPLAGWLAGGILLLDPMLLTQSRLALLDAYAAGFAALALAAATFGTKRGTLAAAIFLGLGFASKMTVLFWGPPVLGVALWSAWRAGRLTRGRLDLTVVLIVLTPLLIWIISYLPWLRLWVPDMGLVGALGHLVALTRDSFSWVTSGVQEHVDASSPWEWFLLRTPMLYWSEFTPSNGRFIYAIGNPVTWWIGAATSIVGAGVAVAAIATKRAPIWAQRFLVGSLPLLAVYGGFFLLSRTSFIFYMTSIVPVVALSLGGALTLLANRPLGRLVTVSVMVLAIAGFATYEPLATGELISTTMKQQIFDAIPWMDP